VIWILATRGAATKLRASPFTETVITGVHSVVYRPGIEPIPVTGEAAAAGTLGTYVRGLRRISGVVFSYDASVAETLFGVTADIDLIFRYRANGQKRKRTLLNVVFVGDAAVTVPPLNDGTPELIGVPFRVQIPEGDTLAAHVVDAVET